MTRHIFAAALIVLVCGAPEAFAQQKPGWKRQPTPYSGLFQPRDLTEVARAEPRDNARPSTEPRVVCGMKVIPMDPNIDPKIFIPRQPDDTRYTIRSVPPPICK